MQLRRASTLNYWRTVPLSYIEPPRRAGAVSGWGTAVWGRGRRRGAMWQNRIVAPSTLIGIFAFLFGLIIGSFLNVCIVRIPERKSIVMPASACPKCGAAIRPCDNIPVVSWMLLGGKCRACKTKISWMYPVVELLTAVLFWACYYAFGLTTEALKWAIFSALMIVLVFTDLRERILPDVVNFSGFAAGIAAEPGDEAVGRDRAVDRESHIRLPSPGAGDLAGGRAAGRGVRQRAAVAGVGSVFPAARARRHGARRREDDADGRRVSRIEADAADDFGGLGARQRAGAGVHDGAAEGIGLRAAVRNVFWGWPRCW